MRLRRMLFVVVRYRQHEETPAAVHPTSSQSEKGRCVGRQQAATTTRRRVVKVRAASATKKPPRPDAVCSEHAKLAPRRRYSSAPPRRVCSFKLSAQLEWNWNKTETKLFWNCFVSVLLQFHFSCADSFTYGYDLCVISFSMINCAWNKYEYFLFGIKHAVMDEVSRCTFVFPVYFGCMLFQLLLGLLFIISFLYSSGTGCSAFWNRGPLC